MTKIAISPNVNGTGTFTIAAPDSNTNRTLTLPDAGGEVLTNTSDIEAQVKTATSATGAAPIFACRAWVNFNGTDTVAIRASGNVSSITDNGVGRYTVNFATAMQDVNYCVTLAGVKNNSTDDANFVATVGNTTRVATVGSVPISTAFVGLQAQDFPSIFVAIFR